MNKFIKAVKDLNIEEVKALIQKQPDWLLWSEADGKNALHYLGGVTVSDSPLKAAASLQILDVLLAHGMDINAVHKIMDGCDIFPATPLWYAYTRGRNRPLYTQLLTLDADPQNCMFAIAWYNDVAAAQLFKIHGANIEAPAGGSTPFMAAYLWRRFEIAEWFLKNGADVNTVDAKGNTAMYYALKRKYKKEPRQLLLDYGATHKS